MEYAKDEIFNITYNTTLNKLEIKQKKWTSRLKKIIKSNKLIISVISLFIIFCMVDAVLIYYFMRILSTIQ